MNTSDNDQRRSGRQSIRCNRRSTMPESDAPTTVDAKCTSRGYCASIGSTCSTNSGERIEFSRPPPPQFPVPQGASYARTIESIKAVPRPCCRAGSGRQCVVGTPFARGGLRLRDRLTLVCGLHSDRAPDTFHHPPLSWHLH